MRVNSHTIWLYIDNDLIVLFDLFDRSHRTVLGIQVICLHGYYKNRFYVSHILSFPYHRVQLL